MDKMSYAALVPVFLFLLLSGAAHASNYTLNASSTYNFTSTAPTSTASSTTTANTTSTVNTTSTTPTTTINNSVTSTMPANRTVNATSTVNTTSTVPVNATRSSTTTFNTTTFRTTTIKPTTSVIVTTEPPNNYSPQSSYFITHPVAINVTTTIRSVVINVSTGEPAFDRILPYINASRNGSNTANYPMKNTSPIKILISNYTPRGFTPLNGSISVSENGSAMLVAWSAENVSERYGANKTSIEEASPVANSSALRDYLNSTFGPTQNISVTSYSDLHVAGSVHRNAASIRYVRINATAYHNGSSTVFSLVNVPANSSAEIGFENGTQPMVNLTVSLKRNLSMSATQILVFKNLTNLSARARMRIPPPPANFSSLIYINSSINESYFNYVNYTMAVPKGWLGAHGFGYKNVSIFRFNATASDWVKLPTAPVGENGSSYFYSARSNGMSVYAIGVGSAAASAGWSVFLAAVIAVLVLAYVLVRRFGKRESVYAQDRPDS